MGRSKKRVSESSVTMAQIMLPQHANPAGNVHGGVVMKMIDDAAGAVAIRHARNNCVTASIDRLNFIEPVYVGNLVTLKASLNYVGRTSMEVGVRVEAEDMTTGEVRHTSSAYLTFVAMCDDGKPAEVAELVLETEEEKRHFENAKIRIDERLKLREKFNRKK